MATPRPAVARPTPEEFFELVASPPVKIYVGDNLEPYVLPRDLLAYYSPYFAACFRPNAFKEGVEGVLRLPEEKPEFFEVLMNYMRSHEGYLDGLGFSHDTAIAKCKEFIVFCDKYDILEATSAATQLVQNHALSVPHRSLRELIDLAFEKLDNENELVVEICKILARELLDESGNNDDIELYLLNGNDAIAGRVMKEFLKLTVARTESRILFKGYN